MNNNTLTNYHFIGIGGIGMSALAKILLQKGLSVSGSDIRSSPIIENLKSAGARITLEHHASNVPANSTVIYSSDISSDNSEYTFAKQNNLNILHRSQLLHLLAKEKIGIAITGSHGKTTTSALLSHVLCQANEQPSFVVGGILPNYGTNALHGQGKHFVFEADESDGTHLNYQPNGGILLNIDNDHLNHYKTVEAIKQSMIEFCDKISDPELLFVCGDDNTIKNFIRKGITYGFDDDNRCRIKNFEQRGWSSFFDIEMNGEFYRNIELSLPGKHIVSNATAVFALCLSLGIREHAIRKAFSSFNGVKRRCEKKGFLNNILFFDDYAHHPNEIHPTLTAIKQALPEKRLIVVFQPHRFSRTHHLFNDFKDCFKNADITMITDIYASNEKSLPGIDAQGLCANINAGALQSNCRYCPSVKLIDELQLLLQENDVLVTMGAGDIYKLHEKLLNFS